MTPTQHAAPAFHVWMAFVHLNLERLGTAVAKAMVADLQASYVRKGSLAKVAHVEMFGIRQVRAMPRAPCVQSLYMQLGTVILTRRDHGIECYHGPRHCWVCLFHRQLVYFMTDKCAKNQDIPSSIYLRLSPIRTAGISICPLTIACTQRLIIFLHWYRYVHIQHRILWAFKRDLFDRGSFWQQLGQVPQPLLDHWTMPDGGADNCKYLLPVQGACRGSHARILQLHSSLRRKRYCPSRIHVLHNLKPA